MYKMTIVKSIKFSFNAFFCTLSTFKLKFLSASVLVLSYTLLNYGCSSLQFVGVLNDREDDYKSAIEIHPPNDLIAESNGFFADRYTLNNTPTHQNFKELSRPEDTFLPSRDTIEPLLSSIRDEQKVQVGINSEYKETLQSILNVEMLINFTREFLEENQLLYESNEDNSNIRLLSSNTNLLFKQKVVYSYIIVIENGSWPDNQTKLWLEQLQQSVLSKM